MLSILSLIYSYSSCCTSDGVIYWPVIAGLGRLEQSIEDYGLVAAARIVIIIITGNVDGWPYENLFIGVIIGSAACECRTCGWRCFLFFFVGGPAATLITCHDVGRVE